MGSVSLTHLAVAEFKSSVGEGEPSVRGDRIPCAPDWLADLSLGFRSRRGLGGRLGLSYVGSQYSDALSTTRQSSDEMKGIMPAHTTYAIALTYQLPGRLWQLYTVSKTSPINAISNPHGRPACRIKAANRDRV
jgi:hypothetical protein